MIKLTSIVFSFSAFLINISCQTQGGLTRKSIITGIVAIGPMCPVEPCNLSQQQKATYYSHFRVVITDNIGRQIRKVLIDGGGRFESRLVSGTYVLFIQPLEGEPGDTTRVNINAGETITVKLNYDTGLR